MKYRFLLLLVLFIFSIQSVFGHADESDVALLEINGESVIKYPVPTASTLFEIPEDLAPGNYIVEKPVVFEIKKEKLDIAPEIITDSKFIWDFGDGQKAEGLKNSHVYKKAGSYLLKIDVSYPKITGVQILQSSLINVVEKVNDQIPNVKIFVNGKKINDPLVDVTFVASGQEVELSAEIESGSNIESYIWDLGNGQTSTEQTLRTNYQKEEYKEQFFPIVRAKTGDGFYADAYAQITTNKDLKQGGQSLESQKKSIGLPLKVVILLVVLIIIFGFYKYIKKIKQ